MDGNTIKLVNSSSDAFQAHPLKERVITGLIVKDDHILLAKKYNYQSLYLPGGTIDVVSNINEQLIIEELALAKFIFEKTGVNTFPTRPIAEIIENEYSRPIKLYLTSAKKISINSIWGKWERNHTYQPVWLKKNIVTTHPYLPEIIKKLLVHYLRNEKYFMNGPQYNFLPVEVLTIAD